tara:strand:- start:40 stop:735 length:696 start_codon:yes stop_codon:yes gene_type:complete
MAITINGNGSITGISAGGLPDGTVDTDMLSDDAVSTAKMAGLARGKIIVGDASGNPVALTVGSSGQALKSDGTDIAWGADTGGKILQYQHAKANTSTNTYGTTWIDTVCTDTITTTKLNSKIWVTATFLIFHMKDTNDSRGGTRLRRDEGGADEFVDGSNNGMYYRKDGNDQHQNNNCRFQYKSHHAWVDSPGKSAGTSITYDLQIAAQSTASNQYISIGAWDMQLWELDV